MIPKDFALERYFAQHEFKAQYLLSSSDCDGYPLSYVLEQASSHELELWEKLTLGYTESEGGTYLREAISEHYKKAGLNNILVSSPGELNFALLNVLLEKGDHVVTIKPSYQSLYEMVETLGCDVSYWYPDPDTWNFDIEKLKELVKANTRLIIINFPHNPTGAYLSSNAIDEVVSIARANNSYLYSDEMYHQLVHTSVEAVPPVADLYEKGISIWGSSKSFGLAGLRIGWLVSQDQQVLQRVQSYKDYLSICSGAPSELLCAIALNHSEKFIQPNLKKIESNIRLFQSFVKRYPSFCSFTSSRSGSTGFVKLLQQRSALEFSEHLVRAKGIMTVPGSMFGYEDHYLRIGFGRRNFPEALEALGAYLEDNRTY